MESEITEMLWNIKKRMDSPSNRFTWSIVILATLLVPIFGCSAVCGQPPIAAVPVNSDETDIEAPLKSLWTRDVGDEWPKFLGPQGDGTSGETGILKDWSEGKLAVVWKQKLGEGYGNGTVAEGRFFQFDRFRGQARVRCFNAETGADLWQFIYDSNYEDLYGYDSGPRTSPLIDGNRVYLFGVEGMLFCLSAETGAKIWELDTNQRFGVIQNFFGVASSPVVVDGLLIVMVGGSPPESRNVAPGALDRVEPNNCGVVGLDKMTGDVKYQIGDELASYAGITLTELDGRTVGYAWLRGSLIGFEVATGEIFLSFPYRHPKLESVNASTPVVKSLGDSNQVFLSECYGIGSVLLQVGRDSHEIIWSDAGRREKSFEAHWNTPLLRDKNLYGCSGRHPGGAQLRCIDWLTGNVRWTEKKFARSSLTGIDGHFVLLDESGRLVLLKENEDRYQQLTEYQGEIKFKPPCWSAPVVSHGLMYVRGRDQLVCFELIPPISQE